MKKIFALVLAMMLCCSAFAEVVVNKESMFPVVEEPITLSMCMLRSASSADDPQDLWFFRYYGQMTNVNWEITEIDSAAWADMKNIMLASDDYPDVFYGPTFTSDELLKYGQEGIFIDLKDYIYEYADNMKKLFEVVPEAEVGMYAPDGNIYSLVYFNPQPEDWYPANCLGFMQINRTWLKNLGLEMPSTLDELYNVLLAFKEQDANGNGDPNDEIPWLSTKNSGGSEPLIMEALGMVYTGSGYIARRVATDEVVFLPSSDEYRYYLEYMNKLYSKGIINDSYFTLETTERNATLVPNDGVYTVGLTTGYDEALWTENRTFEEFEYLYPMTSEYNDYAFSPRRGAWGLGVMQVTDKCEHPEVAVRWADTFFDPMQSWLSADGPEYGTEADLDGIGFIASNLSQTTRPVGFTEANPENYGIWEYFCRYIGPRNKGTPWHTGLYDQYAKREAYGAEAMTRYEGVAWEDMTMTWYQYLDAQAKYSENLEYAYVVGYLAADDSATVSELWQPLEDYVKMQSAKFITGELSFDEYDKFVEQMNKLGADKINAIYHDTYEASKAMAAK